MCGKSQNARFVLQPSYIQQAEAESRNNWESARAGQDIRWRSDIQISPSKSKQPFTMRLWQSDHHLHRELQVRNRGILEAAVCYSIEACSHGCVSCFHVLLTASKLGAESSSIDNREASPSVVHVAVGARVESISLVVRTWFHQGNHWILLVGWSSVQNRVPLDTCSYMHAGMYMYCAYVCLFFYVWPLILSTTVESIRI